MADVKKIAGYNIKDESARSQISTLAGKFILSSAFQSVTYNWVGTSGDQRLEILFTLANPNTKLLLQFTYDNKLNFFVTNDNGQNWSLIWSK